ncbi:orotate phosphoribosyltransferase [Muribaculum sp. An289]|uniref:orotate phosphoribosyltransferase n=1 Tax=unclassified Muribaculum TaxID=2622126 RepID=UPI000B36B0B5|nr:MULTISPECIES: orotate phosphoribosyltransferase [unclassified Muribaculum]OUO37490.1 orotate phosphoribosyltransferase [Muribaculum sp. An289]OUO43409.1 orotate phosphoribosyltransferase [Muribaculum sp. An287]
MEKIEKKVAESLLEIKAVTLSPEKPYTWASGWKSPIYCDNRKILSYPKLRREIAKWIAETVKENFKESDIVAGVATGAIAIGILVAEILEKPFIYVRPKPKDHGTGAMIEGVLPEGAKVVVIEDLISTGNSSLSAVDALRRSGAIVSGMVAIFSYNFPQSREAFENANVELHTLTNYDTLLDMAQSCGYIREEDMELLREWRYSPANWGKNE